MNSFEPSTSTPATMHKSAEATCHLHDRDFTTIITNTAAPASLKLCSRLELCLYNLLSDTEPAGGGTIYKALDCLCLTSWSAATYQLTDVNQLSV